MTRSDLARLRLLHQHITRPASGTPATVVSRLGAVQAQDFTGAKWALGLRLKGATEAGIERAFNAGSILRTHLLRPTWHFVTPADIRWLLTLTAPRVNAANAPGYRRLGLDDHVFRRSNGALEKALGGGTQLTRDELRGVLRRAGVVTAGESRMGHLLMRAELEGLICSGPRKGRQFTYALLDARVPPTRPVSREEALAELAGRYFTSRGPATVQDLAKWSGLTVADAKVGLEAAKLRLRREVVDGEDVWMPATGPAAGAASATTHLLSVYDEYFSGYKDRMAMAGPTHARTLNAMGAALGYLIVVDGRIVGTWRRAIRKDVVVIETRPFGPMTRTGTRDVAAAARRFGAFLGLRVELVKGKS